MKNAANNTYLGSEEVKNKYVSRLAAHIAADELVKGIGWENGKGCFIGCTLEKYEHEDFETEIGPEWLARLCDQLFEGQIEKDSKEFAAKILTAIPVGRNLGIVKWRFCAFVLNRNIERVLTLKIAEDLKIKVVDAIRQCLSLHTSAIESGKWDESAARSARSAAESARSAAESAWAATRSARSAARSAAESAARSAAESARSAARSAAESARSAVESAWAAAESAWSAARSAWSAAWSAARSAARSAAESAWSAEFKLYADKLIELLEEVQ